MAKNKEEMPKKHKAGILKKIFKPFADPYDRPLAIFGLVIVLLVLWGSWFVFSEVVKINEEKASQEVVGTITEIKDITRYHAIIIISSGKEVVITNCLSYLATGNDVYQGQSGKYALRCN